MPIMTTRTTHRTTKIPDGKKHEIESVSDRNGYKIEVKCEYTRLRLQPRQIRSAVINVNGATMGVSHYTPEGNGHGLFTARITLGNDEVKETEQQISKKEWIDSIQIWTRETLEEQNNDW